jgi:hypothetical protein
MLQRPDSSGILLLCHPKTSSIQRNGGFLSNSKNQSDIFVRWWPIAKNYQRRNRSNNTKAPSLSTDPVVEILQLSICHIPSNQHEKEKCNLSNSNTQRQRSFSILRLGKKTISRLNTFYFHGLCYTHHSLFSVLAGFVSAALIDWKPTVSKAMSIVIVPVATNTHHSIPTL